MIEPREPARRADQLDHANGSPLARNVAASVLGNTWAALLAIALVPVYVGLLGIEAWGVIGLFIALQGVCALLDLGLSVTLTREVARLTVKPGTEQRVRDLTRTLELIYWSIAALMGCGVFLVAPMIAHHWVQTSRLPLEVLQGAIRTMAIVLFCQWPFTLYSGGLVGLQRQALLASIIAGVSTLRGAGAVLILWAIAPTLQAFFLWQLCCALLQTCLAGFYLWRYLPAAERRAAFRASLLTHTWRFTLGIGSMTLISVSLTQLDKVVLSRFLSLEMFGYYMLASAVAASIYLIVAPIYSALYPRFTQLVSLGDEQALGELYHRSCQALAALILPIGVVLILFSKQLLFVWTGDRATAEHSHLVLSILAIGTTLNGLIYLPYALQFAHGWTKLALRTALIAAALLTPLIIGVATLYGAVGAAGAWVLFHACALIVVIQLMHRRLYRGEQGRWYLHDVGVPLAIALGAGLLGAAVVPMEGQRLRQLLALGAVGLFVAATTLLATPVTRMGLLRYFTSQRTRALELP